MKNRKTCSVETVPEQGNCENLPILETINIFNPEKTLFRSSNNGNLMSSPKSKADKEAGNLSKGAESFCLEVFINEKYNRKKNFTNKYVQKGLAVEEDAITLLSLETKRFFKKNEKHLKNEYIKGTPDCFEGKSLETATKIIDVKASFDIFTFFDSKTKPLNKIYYWQLQSYMWLTGAKEAELIYCLVDTPESIINDEKRRLAWSMNLIDADVNPDYIKACEEIDRVSLYGDIPRSERIHIIPIKRNDEDIERLKAKVLKAREYLKTLNNER